MCFNMQLCVLQCELRLIGPYNRSKSPDPSGSVGRVLDPKGRALGLEERAPGPMERAPGVEKGPVTRGKDP